MKARSILFSVLICTVCFGYGQSGNPVSLISEISDSTNLVTKTIIRDYEGLAVAYIEKGGKHYFTVSEKTSRATALNIAMKKAEISSDYSINDFIFYGKNLYCCGTFTKECGFIGSVKITDFIESNSFDFKVYSDFKDQGNIYKYVKELTKLVMYQYSDIFYIASIGKTIDQYKKERGCVMIVAMSPEGANMFYKVGESSLLQETFNDIEVTPNYVVTVGSVSSSPDATIRRFSKYSILTNQPYSSTVYKYPTEEDIPTLHLAEDLKDFLITKVIGDTVAIASYWYYPPSANLGTNLKGTLFRLYDLANPSAPTMMTSMSIDQAYYYGNWKLKELQYNDSLQSFVLLQNAEVSQHSLQSMITRLKFSPLSAQSEYYPNIEITSLDNIESSVYCLLNGYSKPLADRYFMIANKLDNYNSNNTCGIYKSDTISFKTIYGSKTDNISLNTFGENFKFIPIGYLSITTEVFNNSCRKH